MNAASYIRKSICGKDEDGFERQEGSFDRQETSIEDYVRRSGITIIRKYEEPVSGKSMLKRKEFLRMVADAKKANCPFKVIVFGEYDRFMRNVHEAWRYELELRDAGIQLHFSNLRNDGSESEEIYKDMWRRQAAEYSRELARKVLQGMVRKAKKGYWLGGVPPYGYRSVKDESRKCSKLVIYEPEAEVVRVIFKYSLQNWGHRKIARWLNAQGIPSSETARKRNSVRNRNPDGKWSEGAVRAILRNPIYKGVKRWNKRARVDCFDWTLKGKGTIEIGKLRTENNAFRKNAERSTQRSLQEFYMDRTKPQEEWITADENDPSRESVEPIVSAEVFDSAQGRFRAYASRKWKRTNNAKYLMSGMVCSCGNRFHGSRISKKLSTGETAFYEIYRCSGDVRKDTHPSGKRNITMPSYIVDGIVIKGLSARIEVLVRVERVKQLFEAKRRAYLQSSPDRLNQVETDLRKTKAEIERMIVGYTKFALPIPDDKVQELRDKQKSLEAQRDGLIAAGHDKIRSVDFEADQFLENIGAARKGIEIGDPDDRIRIREAFVQRTEVDCNQPVPVVSLFWRKVPKFAGCETPPTSSFYPSLHKPCFAKGQGFSFLFDISNPVYSILPSKE